MKAVNPNTMAGIEQIYELQDLNYEFKNKDPAKTIKGIVGQCKEYRDRYHEMQIRYKKVLNGRDEAKL